MSFSILQIFLDSVYERRSLRAIDLNERPVRLVETRFIAGLPDLRERDRAVEPVEDAERQSDPLHDGPGEEPVEIELHRVRHHFLRLERVDDPHGQVADQQEGDYLSARLAAIVLRQVNPSTRNVRDEQHLKDHLCDRQKTGHHHQKIGFVCKRC